MRERCDVRYSNGRVYAGGTQYSIILEDENIRTQGNNGKKMGAPPPHTHTRARACPTPSSFPSSLARPLSARRTTEVRHFAELGGERPGDLQVPQSDGLELFHTRDGAREGARHGVVADALAVVNPQTAQLGHLADVRGERPLMVEKREREREREREGERKREKGREKKVER